MEAALKQEVWARANSHAKLLRFTNHKHTT